VKEEEKKKRKTLTQPSPASGRGLMERKQLFSFSRLREKAGMRVFFLLPHRQPS